MDMNIFLIINLSHKLFVSLYFTNWKSNPSIKRARSKIKMGGAFSILDYFLIPLLEGVLHLYNVVPFSTFWTYKVVTTGLIKLVVHRVVLEKNNLYRSESNSYFLYLMNSILISCRIFRPRIWEIGDIYIMDSAYCFQAFVLLLFSYSFVILFESSRLKSKN